MIKCIKVLQLLELRVTALEAGIALNKVIGLIEALAGKADLVHTHTIQQVTNLSSALESLDNTKASKTAFEDRASLHELSFSGSTVPLVWNNLLNGGHYVIYGCSGKMLLSMFTVDADCLLRISTHRTTAFDNAFVVVTVWKQTVSGLKYIYVSLDGTYASIE